MKRSNAFGFGLVLTWVLALGWAGSPRAETLTLRPVADTTLFEPNSDNNLGGDSTLAAGTTARGLKSRALLKFDVAGNLPAGAVITSAALQLSVIKSPIAGPQNSTFELRRVLVSWEEGRKTGATGTLAGPGEATWKARSAPAVLWSEPGGVDGTDYSTTISGTVPISGTGSPTVASTPDMVADATFWLQNPEANFGWVLRTQAEATSATARRFGARENAATAPALVLEYEISAAPLRIAGISITGTNGVITWTGGTPPFQLQRKHTADDPNWAALSQIETNRADFAIDADQAFFRVLEIAP